MWLFVIFSSVCLCLTEGASLEPHKRVISGQRADASNYPWLVHILFKSIHRDEHCVGSIIADDLVLTAAHCFEEKDKLSTAVDSIKVTVGMADRYNLSPNQKTYAVKKITHHNEYSYGLADRSRHNDISLIQLKTKISMNKDVQIIQLPKQGNRIAKGTVCTYASWGTTMFNTSTDPPAFSFPQYPQKGDVPIIDDAVCTDLYLWTEPWAIVDEDTMVCTGGTSAPCEGDSGLPLSCKENGQWVLRGVGSWSTGGCIPARYAVFTRVSSFIKWISNQKASL